MVTLDEGGWAAAVAGVRAAPPELARHVQHVFTVDFRDAGQRGWKILPDTCGHVLVTIAGPGRGEARTPSVVGARSRAVHTDVAARRWTVGVRFRPGALASLLGDHASRLTDRGAGVGAVWGSAGDALDARVRGSDDPAHVTDRIIDFLRRRVASAPEPDWRAVAYARIVDRAAGSARVGEAAALMGVSERGLRATVSEAAGLPPKLYARVDRLFRAIASRGRPTWAVVATRCGFADQAHLVREFRDLVGETPTCYLARGRRVPIRSRRSGADDAPCG